MAQLAFKLVAPEGIIFDDVIDEVQVPTPAGTIAVLADHMPLITPTKTGVLEIKSGNDIDHFAAGEGVLTITKDGATLAASAAEHANSIDSIQAQKDADAAKAKLEKQLTDEEIAVVEGTVERHLARLDAFQRHKTYHKRH